MKYPFPIIKNISQVLPLIKDRPEFIVAEKEGGYTVVNYVVQMADTFPPVYGVTVAKEHMTVDDIGAIVLDTLMYEKDMTLLRELRGCIFETATGNILHRRYHKFFNVNERPETQLGEIDFSKPHVILEKLDGSMITPVKTTDGIRWGTKMGVTEVALPVEEFVNKPENEQYIKFAKSCVEKGYTPIFEWCSRKQAIVIDYPEDMLVLTAMRDNVHGTYASYQELFYMGQGWKLPVVKAYAGTAESMADLVSQTKDLIGVEGFVVRFDDGHMIKVKAEDYLLKHKTKDALSLEKNVIEILVSEKADDLKAFMDAKDLARFNEFEAAFWDGVTGTVNDLKYLRMVKAEGLDSDRKTYAIEFVQKQDSKYAQILYKMFDYKSSEVFGMVKGAIAKSCSTKTKVDEVRWMFNCEWNGKILPE